MKSASPPSHYDQDAPLANGTYVKVYSLGMGRGILVTWIYSILGVSNLTNTSTIRLTVQDGSTADLVLPTSFITGGSSTGLGREFILPLIVKSASVISNAADGA